MIGYNELDMLLKYHEHMTYTKKANEENVWLEHAKQNCRNLGIDIDKICKYVCSTRKSCHNASIWTLVGERWLTDEAIDSVFGIINKKHNNTVCFVCKPTRFLYSSAGLNEKIFNLSRIFVALNVGHDDQGTYVSGGNRQGVHWALLIIDVKNGILYYADSLCWSVPNNLTDTVGSNLKRMEEDLGINLSTSLKNVIDIKSNTGSESCKLFYPLQSCSNVCGVIVVCMAVVICDNWELWLKCGNRMREIPMLSNPSTNSMQLRLIALSWIVEDNVTATHLDPQNKVFSDTNIPECTCEKEPYVVCEGHACINYTDIAIKPANQVTNSLVYAESDDALLSTKWDISSPPLSNDSESGDELIKFDDAGRSQILNMLPSSYTYKNMCITHFSDLNYFHCEFRIKLQSEECARKWVSDYKEKIKETMVYDSCKNLSGKKVVKKWYLRCQHKQRQTGMHTKSTKQLKTTHKEHNNKHTDCPAQMVVKLLPPKTHDKFLVGVALKHTHNHMVNVADALRFRPLSESTKEKYYDLFRQGHSPSSAHLEYETHLTYMDNPKVLAGRNVNPKVSDVYNLFNKWRKSNLGVRTGKQLFTELEKRVNVYNDTHRHAGGRVILQRFCKGSKEKDDFGVDQPLILAICTPLMSRVHQYIHQSKELVFVDASSSFEDFNNPLFVMSTSSAAGGLPLGIVVTSAESVDVIHNGMTALKEVFPKSAFYQKGYPANIIIDDSSAEREGLKKTWPDTTIYMCTFHFLQSLWRWLLCSKNNIHRDERQYLMNLVRKLVYAKQESELNGEYQQLKNNTTVNKYPNFRKHMEGYWKRRKEWALCYRTSANECMRGINTNNYAESGIRILKDIVFRRLKAYNLVQLFEFLTVTFELYYERRLLAVAHNRMDRYISLRYKGLGAKKVALDAICQSTKACHIYLVKSTNFIGMEYEVDTSKWTCTCTVSRTGYPSGEPCKHQHSVAQKYNLIAPNLLPYFNGEGRYLHALIALGQERAGDKTFYVGMKETMHLPILLAHTSVDMQDETCTMMDTETSDHCEGEENLEMMLSIMEEQEKLKVDIVTLGNAFVEDVQQRMAQMDMQYLTGLKKLSQCTLILLTVQNQQRQQLQSCLHYCTPTFLNSHHQSTYLGQGGCMFNQLLYPGEEKGSQRVVKWLKVADHPSAHFVRLIQTFK